MPLGHSEPKKEDLAATAAALDVEGRSTMTKDELQDAVDAAGSNVSAVLFSIQDLWATVGFDTVNDQPVKNPTDDELEKLADMLKRASGYVATVRKARG